jgi:hypothetical protein
MLTQRTVITGIWYIYDFFDLLIYLGHRTVVRVNFSGSISLTEMFPALTQRLWKRLDIGKIQISVVLGCA